MGSKLCLLALCCFFRSCLFKSVTIKPGQIALTEILYLENSLERVFVNAHIMSKIECQKAVDNAESIVSNTDSIMVARGCLAVNVGIENMIKSQNIVINECIKRNKTVCVASNILRSLSFQNCPSRADIADLSYMIMNGVSDFVITDRYCMEDKFDNLMYFINNTYLIYSRRV